jgi:hypothetical protein
MNNMDLLLPVLAHRNLLVWATVTDDSPLTIRLDGDTTPMLGVPDNLVGALTIGDRVWVALVVNADPAFHGRRAIILGRNGGATATTAPYAVLRRVAAQTLNNDTNVPVEWDTAVRDTHNGWADAGTNPSRYTLPISGAYDFMGLAAWSANATARRAVHLLKNGAGVDGTQVIGTAQAIGVTSLFFAGSVTGVAGDYLGVNMWQNSGTGLTTATALPTVSVTFEYKGP